MYTHSMETIYPSLSAQEAVGTFFMKPPVVFLAILRTGSSPVCRTGRSPILRTIISGNFKVATDLLLLELEIPVIY